MSINKFLLQNPMKDLQSTKTNTINKNIAFMLGRSAFEIGKYEEALSAYNRVLLEDFDNPKG